jgi:hypothetical protein
MRSGRHEMRSPPGWFRRHWLRVVPIVAILAAAAVTGFLITAPGPGRTTATAGPVPPAPPATNAETGGGMSAQPTPSPSAPKPSASGPSVSASPSAPGRGTPATPAAHSSRTHRASPSPSPGHTTDPSEPSGSAMPVGNQPGWRQVFADDFTGHTLDPNWMTYTGQPDGDPGGYFSPSHVSVGDDMLTIGGWKEKAHGNIYVTGGVATRAPLAQTYGKYEVRFRADMGRGIGYVALLWPASNQDLPEIDFAEDNGKLRNRLYTTLHPKDGTAEQEKSVAGDFTQWHTAGLEWTPGKLVYSLDGKVWATITSDKVPTEPMTLALQTQGWYCGHSWEACPDSSTPARVNMQVDWAVMYAMDR